MSQATALLWSIVIEAAVAAAVVRATRWGRPQRAAAAAALATVVTHWLAWQTMLRFADPDGYLLVMTAIEAAVIAVEAVIYRLIVVSTSTYAFATSLIANVASAGAGLLLDALDLL